MKTFVLTVSRTFPKTHKRAGQQTWFVEKINEAVMPISDEPMMGKKIQTIRANYELWAKRIKEVQEGKAILSLRYWSDKPYRSKQVEFAVLDKDSGVGVQKLDFFANSFIMPRIDGSNFQYEFFHSNILCKNDGLEWEDFKDWFKNYDLSKPMAIIHFTSFRY